MKSLFCIAVTAFLSIQPLSGVNAVEPVPASGNPDSRDRPRIGLVLGGGGARGGAQIGVLRVLEELRVPVDYIAGSSIGAIVGGMYAAGMSPDRMSAEVARIDWNDLFRDAPPRTSLSFRRKEDDWFNYFGIELGVSSRGVQAPAGFLSGQKLSFKLNSLTLHTTDIDEFDDLPVPFRAMATDLNTGEPVAIDRGSLAKAMRASMSISGVINPVEWDGRLLVDGAISDNLPVTTVREMGADIIIAVDVAPRFVAVESGRSSLLEVGIQTLLVLMAENSRRSQELLGEGDFLLAPELEGIELMSFDRMHEAEEGGEIAARQIAAKLSAYSLSDDDYADYLRRHRQELVPPQTPFVVDSLSIVSGERVPESLIRRRLETGPGEALDLDILFDDLKRVYQIGEFDYVGYRFERNSATDHLTIKAQEKAWGPGYLRFGMRIEAVDGAETDFQLLFNYRRAFINRLGAEWLTRLNLGDRHLLDSEFFQPLNRAGWLFLAPRIRFVNDKAVVMAAGGGHDVLDHQKAYGQLDLGFQFSNTAELRLGVRRGSQRIKLRSSPDSWSGSDIGEWVGRLGLDVLDDVGFPTRGGNLFVETRLSRTGIGAAKDFDRLWARGVLVGSVGRTSAALRGEFGTDFSNTLPYGERFRLGGFMRISGLQPGDRSGGALGLASLALYRNMAPLPQILGSAWYLGVTGEAGNVWPTIREASKADVWFGGSVFLGLGTIVGPVYIAYGLAEGGPKTFYVVLGPHSY